MEAIVALLQQDPPVYKLQDLSLGLTQAWQHSNVKSTMLLLQSSLQFVDDGRLSMH